MTTPSARTTRHQSAGTATPSLPSTSGDPYHTYPDLGARVSLGAVPPVWAARLPSLYSSSYSVLELIDAYFAPAPFSACRLEDPEHVLLFTQRGRTAEIVNRVFSIEPDALDRAVTAILRAVPELTRVSVEVQFPPEQLSHPTLTLDTLSDFVVSLPTTPRTVYEELSRSGRKHTRNYRNRLQRDHPEHVVEHVERQAIDGALLQTVADLVEQRMSSKGFTSQLPSDFSRRMLPFAQRWGCVGMLRMDGRIVAAELCSRVGDQAFDHAGSFDPRYAHYELGWQCILENMERAVERGCSHFHLLWGDHGYKRRLGGVPKPLRKIAVYRDATCRVLAAPDWGGVVAVRCHEAWTKGCTGARCAVARALHGAAPRRRQ